MDVVGAPWDYFDLFGDLGSYAITPNDNDGDGVT